MTCYQRHLTGVFELLDLPYDRAARDSVHRALVVVLGLPEEANCPEVWKALKETYGPVDRSSDVLARDIAETLRSLG